MGDKASKAVRERPSHSIEWLCKDDSGMGVSNFSLCVQGMVEIVSSDSKRFAVRVDICFESDEHHEIELECKELDIVEWNKIDPRCIINKRCKNAQEYIANIIRLQLQSAPREIQYELEGLGIKRLNEKQIVFVLGDRVTTRSSDTDHLPCIRLQKSAVRLDIDSQITAEEAFDGMRELIRLSSQIGRVLVAHVISGMMRAAFKEAGFTPCAVLLVTGESGMLKSHYVPHLTQLYNRKDGIKAETRFNSTACYIEEILSQYNECTVVIDDLHTAESKSSMKRNEVTAEEILRRISDNTGRGHKEGNTLVQKEFGGNAVFIGEYTIGKGSTISRALVVPITKRPNGSILYKYQQKPLLVSTFYYFFITWYVDHYDDICELIDERLSRFRQRNEEQDIHGRLCDTQFYLQISYMFFLEFCRDSGFLSTKDVIGEYKDFCCQLEALIIEQHKRCREDDTGITEVDYLKLIRKLYQSNSFKLAKCKDEFDINKHDGLYHYDGYVCLRGQKLVKKICKIIPDTKQEQISRYLLDKGALKQVKEKNTVQIDGTRFYAIKQDLLE